MLPEEALETVQNYDKPLVNTVIVDEAPITFIDAFDIPANQIDTFITQWEHRSRLMSSADGFISAELHRAV